MTWLYRKVRSNLLYVLVRVFGFVYRTLDFHARFLCTCCGDIAQPQGEGIAVTNLTLDMHSHRYPTACTHAQTQDRCT